MIRDRSWQNYSSYLFLRITFETLKYHYWIQHSILAINEGIN